MLNVIFKKTIRCFLRQFLYLVAQIVYCLFFIKPTEMSPSGAFAYYLDLAAETERCNQRTMY